MIRTKLNILAVFVGVLVLIDWRAELGVIVRTEEFVKEVRSVVEVLHHRREK